MSVLPEAPRQYAVTVRFSASTERDAADYAHAIRRSARLAIGEYRTETHLGPDRPHHPQDVRVEAPNTTDARWECTSTTCDEQGPAPDCPTACPRCGHPTIVRHAS